MNRKNFIKTCAAGYITFTGFQVLLQSCVTARFSDVSAEIVGSDLVVPAGSFKTNHKGSVSHKTGIIVRNENLKYPVCVFRITENEYKAFLMRCTHQGTDLQLFGDRFQCPAHGSEFSSDGNVLRGPAESSLRSFPVTVENGGIKISLK